MSLLKVINPRSDLFATAASFLAQVVIKLGSSLILTRILQPEAYGVITLLLSILFVVEMVSDIAVTVSLVRHKDGDEPRYLNTAWTLRLIRSALNSAIVYACAPFIASLYNTPGLTAPLRVLSLWFVVAALESMSFPLAIRRKNSRIIVYSELTATAVSTAITVCYCYFSRDYWGMVYGALANRIMTTVMSYLFYRDIKPRLQVDRGAARDLLKFTRYAMPSSLLTVALNQFDKIAFLRLFDLHLLGVYGLAGNIAGPVESLITKISQLVLYPRCAHNFRSNPDTFSLKYYTENKKLFMSMLIVPAAIGGAAQLIVAVLYDPRYAQAGVILQAFMVRAGLLSLAAAAEDMLIATGESRIILVGNVFRAIWLVCACLVGYYLFGFMGFVYGTALSGMPPLLYYLWLQRKKGMLMVQYELYKVGFVAGIAISSFFASSLLLTLWTAVRHRLSQY